MLFVFFVGYAGIALEHPMKINKAAPALFIGVMLWAIYIMMANTSADFQFSPNWVEGNNPKEFILGELSHHLAEISETIFFLMGAMTIVEVVDSHSGFSIITNSIHTTNKVKLLWIVSILTFFMSAVLDNLTTIIVIMALLRKLIDDKETRWTFVGVMVIAANAGGAWSPIGDVTTIMLWIGGQISAVNIMSAIFLPSFVTLLIPLIILSFTMKGEVTRPEIDTTEQITTSREMRMNILVLCLLMLLMVPPFKMLTHLPPYMGMLLGLSIVWGVTEFMHRNRGKSIRNKLTVQKILAHIDIPTILFFLGILAAVGALSSVGILSQFAGWLDNVTNNNIYAINLTIGLLSSIVDNVPLVAGAMGMYDVLPGSPFFDIDGPFWEMLAYCAGTGGSVLIIGSAAGVAAMGLEKIDFVWYLKRISLLALIGYLAGAAVFYFMR